MPSSTTGSFQIVSHDHLEQELAVINPGTVYTMARNHPQLFELRKQDSFTDTVCCMHFAIECSLLQFIHVSSSCTH